jgi:integrase
VLIQGVPLRVAMEVLGHSQIHVTANTYQHVIPELKREAAEQVGGLLWPEADGVAVKMAVYE